jgi:hypothetical protein
MYLRIWVDILFAIGGCVIGNIVFNNFERHLPLYRRIAKYAILFAVLALIGLLLGRIAFWSVIGLMAIGQTVLHAWWFPRNGINGLTAEPHERYLELIGRMKDRRRAARGPRQAQGEPSGGKS